MKRTWHATRSGRNILYETRSEHYGRGSPEDVRFYRMVRQIEASCEGYVRGHNEHVVVSNFYEMGTPFFCVIESALWEMDESMLLPKDCFEDCNRAGREILWRLDQSTCAHYFFEHNPNLNSGVRVTIIDDRLLARLGRCRAACIALMNRKARTTLDIQMRRFLARTLWTTRYDIRWDPTQGEEAMEID
jgi:hypothetical protein